MKTTGKRLLNLTERKGKGGEVTVIRHKNGFRTLAVNGKCKTPKGITNSKELQFSILSIGYELLHQFPDFLKQSHNSAILEYTLPAVEDRETSRGLRYSFTYTMNGGSDTETAIKKVLSQLEKINNEITACTKLGL